MQVFLRSQAFQWLLLSPMAVLAMTKQQNQQFDSYRNAKNQKNTLPHRL
jgi:hypothetical protein